MQPLTTLAAMAPSTRRLEVLVSIMRLRVNWRTYWPVLNMIAVEVTRP